MKVDMTHDHSGFEALYSHLYVCMPYIKVEVAHDHGGFEAICMYKCMCVCMYVWHI